MTFNVELKGRIEEYGGTKNLNNSDKLAELNNELESYFETETTAFLQKNQEWQVDPLQIGTKTLTPFTKPMNKDKWLEKWKNMKIKVDFQLDLEPLINIEE